MFNLTAVLQQIKEHRLQGYITRWLNAHRRNYPNDSAALLHCRPTDDDLNYPPKEGAFSTEWGTGYIVIDIALAEGYLSAAQLEEIYKLGGQP